MATTARAGSGIWVALGSIVVLVYVTRVLYRATAIVHALAWDRSAASIKGNTRSFGVFTLGLAAMIALAIGVSALRDRDAVGAFLLFMPGMAIVWLGVSSRLPHSTATWTSLIPGAALFGVGMLLIDAFNVYVLAWVHGQRSNTYGTLGVSAAVLLSLFFIGRLVVGTAVLNATLVRRRAARLSEPTAGADD